MNTTAHTIPAAVKTRFQTSQVLTIVGGHFIHDTYSAFIAPLLPLIIEKLSLSLTLAGSLTAFMQYPSLLNPFIGYLDDRLSLRYLVILAPAFTATMMSSMGIAPNYFSLAILLFLTGFSISAFHAPAPAMVARVSGKQVGKGMSLFMAAGELGRSFGPVLAVWAVSLWGLEGTYRVATLGWGTSLVLYLRFRSIPAHSEKRTGFREMLPAARRLFLPLTALVIARSFLLSSLGVYLPTYLSEQGATLWMTGSALAIYEFAGVGGALLSGTLSDRLGRKPVLFVIMLLSSLLMLTFIQVKGWKIIPVLIILGFVFLASQPVMLSIVQDQLPNHRSLANGVYLTIVFLTRPLTTITVGMFGDALGLRAAFFWSALIALIAIPAVIALPGTPLSD
jgi:FSR family fosmidomycin resistance protein-like MFS transporter